MLMSFSGWPFLIHSPLIPRVFFYKYAFSTRFVLGCNEGDNSELDAVARRKEVFLDFSDEL